MIPRALVPALGVGLLLVTPPALAQGPGREVSLNLTTFSYASSFRPSPGFLALEGAYHQRLAAQGPWSALRLGGGLRTGMPAAAAHFPLEVFAQVQLSARIGIWEVAAGPELGVSGFARLYPYNLLPYEELNDEEDRRMGPVYAGFSAAPVRLHLGRFLVSALELQLGTGVKAFGSVLRTQLGLLRVGVEL